MQKVIADDFILEVCCLFNSGYKVHNHRLFCSKKLCLLNVFYVLVIGVSTACRRSNKKTSFDSCATDSTPQKVRFVNVIVAPCCINYALQSVHTLDSRFS